VAHLTSPSEALLFLKDFSLWAEHLCINRIMFWAVQKFIFFYVFCCWVLHSNGPRLICSRLESCRTVAIFCLQYFFF
jgi:hypothetical protein